MMILRKTDIGVHVQVVGSEVVYVEEIGEAINMIMDDCKVCLRNALRGLMNSSKENPMRSEEYKYWIEEE